MTQIEKIAPVFIAKTKSFWLGIVPAALTLVDVLAGAATDGSAEPIAGAVLAARRNQRGPGSRAINITQRHETRIPCRRIRTRPY